LGNLMNLTLVPASLQVNTETIRAYAELTTDFNPIHVDPVFAARSPMGGVIAHGTLSICLLWQAVYRTFGTAATPSSIELDLRFVKPVREGERLTAGGEASAGEPGRYAVWVRGEDGQDRLAGTLWHS